MARSAPSDNAAQRSVRPKRVAELIADHLRARIINGELRDGDLIPKEDELLVQFPVGRSSVKEAMRILETEGLISVRRGNRGGAVVHTPKAGNVAYTLGLLFGVEKVPISDLTDALAEIEPICVSLAAARDDRAETVVAQMQSLQDRAVAAIDRPIEFTELTREFHKAMVGGCANRPLTIIAGSLEDLWSCHASAAAERADRSGNYPSTTVRRRLLDEHQQLIDLIAAGDLDAAAHAAREHHAWTHPHLPRTRVIRYVDLEGLPRS